MAGSSMTFSYDEGWDSAGRKSCIRKVICDWVSDDSAGTASGTTRKIVGELVKGVTNPGSPAPTDDYDITITDPEGMNVLASSKANLTDRDTTTTECSFFGLTDGSVNTSAFPLVCDELTVAVANAGNSKAGRLVLYVRAGTPV